MKLKPFRDLGLEEFLAEMPIILFPTPEEQGTTMPRKKKETTKAEETNPLKRIVISSSDPRKETFARIPEEQNKPRIVKDVGIKEKTQVDGKDHEAPKARPRTLAALWGYKGDPFGTDDEGEYKGKLSKMNKADLQSTCIKIGLMPHDSRQIMVERLLKQFRQHTAARKTVNIQPQRVPKASEASERLRSWMASAGGNTLI